MEYEVEKDVALKIISDKCKKYNVSAEDATLTREDGEFVIVPGQVGVVIDEEASADASFLLYQTAGMVRMLP